MSVDMWDQDSSDPSTVANMVRRYTAQWGLPRPVLEIGTRIRFLKTLDASANEDHPYIIYAKKGETGEIVNFNAPEGFFVKTDSWPHPFGASVGEFEVLER